MTCHGNEEEDSSFLCRDCSFQAMNRDQLLEHLEKNMESSFATHAILLVILGMNKTNISKNAICPTSHVESMQLTHVNIKVIVIINTLSLKIMSTYATNVE